MGATDDHQHDETAASSPSSSTQHQSELKAAKDRNCPFCGQAFTSSSLGRHLDLYIKPKNPKPADGVHDVDEIRKLRGGITRRQPKSHIKTGSVRRESSGTPHVFAPAPNDTYAREDGNRQGDGSPAISPVQGRDSCRTGFNAAHWSASGVISSIPPPRAPSRNNNTIPASGQAHRVQEMRRDTNSGARIERPSYEANNTWRLQEQAEIGRAAEMALREVLGSVQAARRKAEPEPIYKDFDFYSLPFPGLCLAILPPPSTIHNPAPFATNDSWSLSPPGQTQFEALNRSLQARGAEMQACNIDLPSDSTVFCHNSHLQGAFENWRLMSEKDKQAAWTLQVQRAFSSARDENAKLKAELEASQQRASHLEAEYDRLSRCQLPREFLVNTPRTISLSRAVNLEMAKSEAKTPVAEADYDADTLLERWRETVRSVAKPSYRSSGPSTAPAQTYANSILKPRSQASTDLLQSDMIQSGAVHGIGGPMERTYANVDPMQRELAGNSGHVVSYETPPNPGAITGSADGSPTVYDADADGEVEADPSQDVSHVFDSSITSFVDRNALAKQRRFVHATTGSMGSGSATSTPGNTTGFRSGFRTPSGELNGNGKRPLEAASFGKGTKIYREQ